MENWYAVNTKMRCEEQAACHLRRQGFETYLPQHLRTRRHARRTDRVAAPLFPRYLFVRFDPHQSRWRPILSTIGVQSIICLDGRPQPVPTEVIDEIAQREDDQGFIVFRPMDHLAAGDAVEIVDGPFSDNVGFFEGMSGEDRVAILLNLMGRKIVVSMDMNSIQACA